MLGLGQTTANLARHRRGWQHLLAAGKSARARRPDAGNDTGPFRDVTGFGSNPGDLRMLAYVPDGLPASAPLVVVLHGCTQTAAGYAMGAGWVALADRFGFALLAPEQQRANNPNLCFTWFEPGDIQRDHGEPLSIRQMIERMIVDHRLDRRLVHITGLSAGGAMTSVLLATYPEVFAGGAIVAGLPYGCATSTQEAFAAMFQGVSLPARDWGDRVRAASPHRGPWPSVSVWHGSADSTVKAMNADEIVKQWTDVHGLAGARPSEEEVGGFTRRAWLDASGRALVEDFIIPGMAHGTPIGDGGGETYGTSAPFILDVGISSAFHIAAFWGLAERSPERPRSPSLAETTGTGLATTTDRISDRPSRPARASKGSRRPDPGEPPQHQRQGHAEGARGGPSRMLDPGAVIAKALKAAGLLKR